MSLQNGVRLPNDGCKLSQKILEKGDRRDDHLCWNPNYLLYGTDWPISNMDSYQIFMNQLDIDDDKKEHILWENASELFKMPVKSSSNKIP